MFSSSAPFAGSNTFGLSHGSGGFASNANPFGSDPYFGSAAFGASKIQAFGSEGTSGASNTSAFGSTSAISGFAAPSGTEAFGISSSCSPLVASTNLSSGAFATPNLGAFIGTTPASGSKLFGTSTSPSFGTLNLSGSIGGTPAFGTSSNSQFGSSTGPSFVAFKTPSFGVPTASTPALGTSSSSLFGVSTSPFNSSAFGNKSSSQYGTLTSPSFRAYPTIGCDARSGSNPTLGCQPQGSRLMAYSETRDDESMSVLQSLSAMPIYNNKCHEELRWEDCKSVNEDGDKQNRFYSALPLTSQSPAKYTPFPGPSSGPSCFCASYPQVNTSSPFSPSFRAVTPSVVGPTATWSQHSSVAPFVDQSKMAFNTPSLFRKPTDFTRSSYPAVNNLGNTSSVSTTATGSNTSRPSPAPSFPVQPSFPFLNSQVPCTTVVNTEPTVSIGPTATRLQPNSFAPSIDQSKMSFDAPSSLAQPTNFAWKSFSFLNSEVPSSTVVSTEPIVSVGPTATWLPPSAFAPSDDQSKMTFNTPSSFSDGMMAPCQTTPTTFPACPHPNGNGLAKMPQGVHDSGATARYAFVQRIVAQLYYSSLPSYSIIYYYVFKLTRVHLPKI